MDGPADASVEAKVAGFIVWLARGSGQVKKDQREPCVAHADRFLYWCVRRQVEGGAADENAYLAELSREGQSEAFVVEARTAITLLRLYLAGSGGSA